MFVSRFARSASGERTGGDEGSTLISVLVISMVLGILTVAMTTAVVNTSQVTSGVRSSLQAQAAADAGIAAAVAAAKAHPADVCSIGIVNSSPQYAVAPAIPSPDRPDVTACGTGGKVTFLSTGTGQDGSTAAVEATYTYSGAVESGVPDNAVVIGGGTLSATSLMISVGAGAEDSSALMLSGNFSTCNNITTFKVDVILTNGNMDLTNSCTFEKDVYVAGYVKLDSGVKVGGSIYSLGTVSIENSTVTVGGDIHAKGNVRVLGKVIGSVETEGNLTMPSNGSIGGSASVGGSATLEASSKITGSLTVNGTAKISGSTVTGNVSAGGLDLNSATIGGNLIHGGTAAVGGYNVKAASFTTAGPIGTNSNYLQASTFTGDVVSTLAGAKSYIAPNTTIGGKIRLAGTVSTDWGPPTAAGGNTYGVTGLTTPSVPAKPVMVIPEELQTGTYKWDDYGYDPATWEAAGYTVDVWPTATKCTFDFWNPANVSKLSSYTSPTVVDLRKCGEVYGFQATLALDTDIVLLLADNGKAHIFHEVKFTSKDGQAHSLNIMTPDTVDNDAPTCLNSGSKISLYATSVSTTPLIQGLVYTPCNLTIANVGSNGNWTGQLYSGSMVFDAGGAPGYQMVYQPIGVPGFGVTESTGAALGGLLKRRDVEP